MNPAGIGQNQEDAIIERLRVEINRVKKHIDEEKKQKLSLTEIGLQINETREKIKEFEEANKQVRPLLENHGYSEALSIIYTFEPAKELSFNQIVRQIVDLEAEIEELDKQIISCKNGNFKLSRQKPPPKSLVRRSTSTNTSRS
eukprot:TRINITY_DN6597_c1_g1_i1.p1 TRINITY_DN6597_c1_g1~~TRINITY_DN6597_c1_g1_i1.p1  ORF type:complete len:144 (-),score=69.07 TRINITY_DN6597_c1_g1_i1:51-482(-)